VTQAGITMPTLAAHAGARLDRARTLPRDGLVRRRVATPAIDLDLHFADPALADLYHRRLVNHGPGDDARRRVDILLLDPTVPGWTPPLPWAADAWFASRAFDATLAQAGLRGAYHEAPSWQFFDPADGFGVHDLPAPGAVPPWEPGSPLRLFLHWAHAGNGLRLTHAATLSAGGRGALIVGASGSGKSGTTLAGLRHGLASAGDDYVLVGLDGEVTAHAVFRLFKQDAAGLARVGLKAGAVGSPGPNWHGKHEFDPTGLGAFVLRMPIDMLLLPQIAGAARTRIEPVVASRAAMALAPSAVLQLAGDMDDGFRFFARLARRLPAYRIALSEDPAEIAGAIGDFLAGAARAG